MCGGVGDRLGQSRSQNIHGALRMLIIEPCGYSKSPDRSQNNTDLVAVGPGLSHIDRRPTSASISNGQHGGRRGFWKGSTGADMAESVRGEARRDM